MNGPYFERKVIDQCPHTLTGCERLAEALEYAVAIIGSYEMDFRNSEEFIGVDLVQLGFCQGIIYKDALPRIERILEGTSRGR